VFVRAGARSARVLLVLLLLRAIWRGWRQVAGCVRHWRWCRCLGALRRCP
jgi:hypothetical protein